LGLSICRRIVEAHGGRIQVLDAHRGARFVVELPLAAYTVGSDSRSVIIDGDHGP
jgi:signal transduction histidine kinase